MSKTTTLHVQHAFLCISLLSQNNYDVKWPDFKFIWVRERQADKFCHLCLNSRAVPSFHLQRKFPFFFLSNWATWDNGEKKVKGCEVYFSGTFSWTSPLSERKVPGRELGQRRFWFERRTLTGSEPFSLWRHQLCIAMCLYSYRDDLPKNLFKITAE